MDLERALDCFCAGFSYTRSHTHKCVVDRTRLGRRMHDAPRKSGKCRIEEFVTSCLDADEVSADIASLDAERFVVSAVRPVGVPEKPVKESFLNAGFRMLRSEPLMVRRLTDPPSTVTSPYRVAKVQSVLEVDAIAEFSRTRQILDADLHSENPNLRLFAAWDGQYPTGWVRSVRADKDATWVSNLFVQPDYRRKGIGSALMTSMLQDDFDRGFEWSVLLASNAGAQLYPNLGYQQIGILTMFMRTPKWFQIHKKS
ncbi:MAG TPA: GNAT family N-acetyltransferase [Fimbriimonadaceae bacterium]|nr:GNAT family N-acetyltransferase [Fimbriimonadaceae bacterium]